MKKKTILTQHIKGMNDFTIKVRLTELKVDRHGDVVKPDGIVLENYEKNPVVQFGHGFGSKQGNVPIGRLDLDTIEVTRTEVKGDIIFDTKDEFAVLIYNKMRDGFLNTVSIGFRPLEIGDELLLENQTGMSILKWELLELSVVAIPALPSATAIREMSDIVSNQFDVSKEKYYDFVQKSLFKEDETESSELFMSSMNIEKAGAVLSKKNKTLVQNAITALKAILDSAGNEDIVEEESEKDIEFNDSLADLVQKLESVEL